MLKVAVTDWFAFIVTVQLPVPLQAPDHPAKKAALAGVAVSLTLVPELNDALHVGAQLMPAGLLVTVPVEVPANCTESWKVVAGATPAGPDGDGFANPLPGSATARVVVKKAVATIR
jgi:hypothetical protein